MMSKLTRSLLRTCRATNPIHANHLAKGVFLRRTIGALKDWENKKADEMSAFLLKFYDFVGEFGAVDDDVSIGRDAEHG